MFNKIQHAVLKSLCASAIALIIVFSMTAATCGGSKGESGSKDGGGVGKLTITDIPEEYNGKYAVLRSSFYRGGKEQVVWGTDGKAFGAGKISNGKAVLSMLIGEDGSGRADPYSGNDTTETQLQLSICNSDSWLSGYKILEFPSDTSITFKNGSSTISAKNAIK